jgi:predicted PurR-regulated permease PerM
VDQTVAIVFPVRTLIMLVVVFVLVMLAVETAGTLLSIFVATVLALGLDPPVSWLERRGWKRGRAALAAFGTVFLIVVLIVLVTVGPLSAQVVEFIHALPGYWDQLTQSDVFKKFVNSASADDTIRNELQKLASGLPEAANVVLGFAGAAFGSILSLITLSFLSLFLVMERPMITGWLFGFTPPETEARWSPVLEDVIKAVSTSLVGNIAISIIAAVVAGVSAWLLGLPFPVVLAVIAGFLDLIPQVGATIAAVILVAVGLTVSTEAGVAMLAIQLVYQQIENYIVYPLVYRTAVQLTALTTIVSVLVASALLGVVGAILAVPFAVMIKITLHEATAPRRARMDALRAAQASAASDDDAPGGADTPAPAGT